MKARSLRLGKGVVGLVDATITRDRRWDLLTSKVCFYRLCDSKFAIGSRIYGGFRCSFKFLLVYRWGGLCDKVLSIK